MKSTTTDNAKLKRTVLKQWLWAVALFLGGLCAFVMLGFIARFLMSLIYPS